MNYIVEGEGITPETAQSYSVLAVQLRSQFEKSSQIFTPKAFAEWLVETKLTRKPRTWRLYRAAVNYYIAVNHPEDAQAIQKYLSGFIAVKDVAASTTKPVRKKAKSYQEPRFLNLIAYLQKKTDQKPDSIWWVNALYTMKAGDLVGLRPVEWEHARLETQDGVTCLVVKNAKNTHGRSHGDYRTLNLATFEDGDIEVIQRKIDLTSTALKQGHAASMKDYHNNVRVYINRANRAVEPKAKTTIAPYTPRHQFGANLKHEGNTPNEVAAQMGHRDNETAGTHYGRRKNGRTKSNLPRATPADLSRVEAFNAVKPVATFGPRF